MDLAPQCGEWCACVSPMACVRLSDDRVMHGSGRKVTPDMKMVLIRRQGKKRCRQGYPVGISFGAYGRGELGVSNFHYRPATRNI